LKSSSVGLGYFDLIVAIQPVNSHRDDPGGDEDADDRVAEDAEAASPLIVAMGFQNQPVRLYSPWTSPSVSMLPTITATTTETEVMVIL
jgi:hypothetical protein